MTVTNLYGVSVGDILTVHMLDTRKWKRILCKLLFMPAPLVKRKFKVMSISGTVGELEPYGLQKEDKETPP
jgi:hypothetical protein